MEWRRLQPVLAGALLLGGCLEADPSYDISPALRVMPLDAGSYRYCETERMNCSDVTMTHRGTEMVLTLNGQEYVLQAKEMDRYKWLVPVKIDGASVFTFVDRHDDGVFHMNTPQCHPEVLKAGGGQVIADSRCLASTDGQAETYLRALMKFPLAQRYASGADVTLRPRGF